MIVCVGDSLTYGQVGYSYIPYVTKKYKLVNRGVNGDSLYDGYRRLKRYLRDDRYEAAGTYIIALGTNDILLPFQRDRSLSWKLQFYLRNKLLKFSTQKVRFAALYEQMVKEVARHGRKLILIGLPYIQLQHYPLGKIKEYNRCIRDIAEKYQVPFIDIYSMQMKHLEHNTVYDWGPFNAKRIWEGTCMFLFPTCKNYLSGKRHLDLTVDGVHFNSFSANMLGKAVEEIIVKLIGAE